MTPKTETFVSIDPLAESLESSIPSIDKIRYLYAFQALGLPKGMLLTKGFTRKRAAQMINDLIYIAPEGEKARIAVTSRSKPPSLGMREAKEGTALAYYISWALREFERRNKGLTLTIEPSE